MNECLIAVCLYALIEINTHHARYVTPGLIMLCTMFYITKHFNVIFFIRFFFAVALWDWKRDLSITEWKWKVTVGLIKHERKFNREMNSAVSHSTIYRKGSGRMNIFIELILYLHIKLRDCLNVWYVKMRTGYETWFDLIWFN